VRGCCRQSHMVLTLLPAAAPWHWFPARFCSPSPPPFALLLTCLLFTTACSVPTL
jgi:hypothetical protein